MLNCIASSKSSSLSSLNYLEFRLELPNSVSEKKTRKEDITILEIPTMVSLLLKCSYLDFLRKSSEVYLCVSGENRIERWLKITSFLAKAIFCKNQIISKVKMLSVVGLAFKKSPHKEKSRNIACRAVFLDIRPLSVRRMQKCNNEVEMMGKITSFRFGLKSSN